MFRLMLALLLLAGCTGTPLPAAKKSESLPTVVITSTSVPAIKPASASVPMKASLPTSIAASTQASAQTSVTFRNKTLADATIYVSFGADSVIQAAAWSAFCTASAPLNCMFTVAAGKEQVLPSAGYLNVTLSAGQPVSCGSTKAEINVNHPGAFDVTDISLVDGFNAKMAIDMNGTILGPPVGKEGNEKVFGVYPLGCDICTARQSPPCGIPAGGPGCKSGTQYKPDVPCQAQGPTVGGGGSVIVNLLP